MLYSFLFLYVTKLFRIVIPVYCYIETLIICCILHSSLHFDVTDGGLAWRSGNGVAHINEVTLRRARLVLGWVTGLLVLLKIILCIYSFFDAFLSSIPGAGHLSRHVTSYSGQLSLANPSWVAAISTSQRVVTSCVWVHGS